MFRARIRAFCAGVGPGGGPVDFLVAMSKILSSLAESGPLEEGGGGGGAGFGGVSESPRTMFTRQYSINAMNTNTVQTDMKASTAFR